MGISWKTGRFRSFSGVSDGSRGVSGHVPWGRSVVQVSRKLQKLVERPVIKAWGLSVLETMKS